MDRAVAFGIINPKSQRVSQQRFENDFFLHTWQFSYHFPLQIDCLVFIIDQ